MALWEVWRYGEGDAARLRFRRPAAEDAVKAFLDRRVATGLQFRDTLRKRGIETVLVCVKDPTVTGSRDSPNYPAIHHVPLGDHDGL